MDIKLSNTKRIGEYLCTGIDAFNRNVSGYGLVVTNLKTEEAKLILHSIDCESPMELDIKYIRRGDRKELADYIIKLINDILWGFIEDEEYESVSLANIDNHPLIKRIEE